MWQRVASCSGVRRRPSRKQPMDVLGHLLPAAGTMHAVGYSWVSSAESGTRPLTQQACHSLAAEQQVGIHKPARRGACLGSLAGELGAQL